MFDVVACLAFEHDLRLVIMALFICIAGSFTYLQLLRRARTSDGLTRVAWNGIASVSVGTTVWSTHFVAMLAFHNRVGVTIDPVLTLLSLILPFFGFFIASTMLMHKKRRVPTLMGGAMIGLCASGMHYMGMSAYRIDGLVEWNTDFIIGSVLAGTILCALAGLAFDRQSNARLNIASVGALVLGVVSMHFAGMTAMRITPLALSGNHLDNSAFIALSLATALAGIMVIAIDATCYFLDFDTRRDNYLRLLKMALTDQLTGLPNRNAHIEKLAETIDRARNQNLKLAVVGMDLNRFKEINDTYGHKAGDAVLSGIATALKAGLRDDEFIARLGGDEFAAAKLFRDRKELTDFIARIQRALQTSVAFEEALLTPGGSIGVSIFPDDGKTSDQLTNNADLAMYRSKLNAIPGATFYEASMDEEVRRKRELASSLANALANDELELYYQVQASVRTGKISGREALLRWTHPEHGPIPPDVFIPIAEDSGLIVRLGEWVLRRACRDAASWTIPDRVAVNVSPLQLMQIELPQIIHQTLLDSGLSPSRLEIELTETAIIEDRDRSLHVLRQIKALGVGVALDDFGTGYSSLEILRSFPFDKIKLDRFFMAEIETSLESKALVRSVLALGKSLSIPVLAEGVESAMQLQILREEGCDEVQGFLLGRPEPLSRSTARHYVKMVVMQDDPEVTRKIS